MRMLTEHGPTPGDVVAEHVAVALSRSAERAFIRLNMIASADGGSAVAGASGALGNRDDHAVFAALREQADAVLVGMSTAVAEHYHAPKSPHLRVYVVAETPDISGAPELFASGRATLVLAEDAGPGPEGVPELRAGTGEQVDLRAVASLLAGKVVVMEGGPTLAGTTATTSSLGCRRSASASARAASIDHKYWSSRYTRLRARVKALR